MDSGHGTKGKYPQYATHRRIHTTYATNNDGGPRQENYARRDWALRYSQQVLVLSVKVQNIEDPTLVSRNVKPLSRP